MANIVCLLLMLQASAPLAAPSTSAGPVLEYHARTDLRADIPGPAPPPLGAAGSIVRDPVMGARMLRVTDSNTFPSVAGLSFHTDASSEQHEWNANGTRFFVWGAGHANLIFDFDAAELRARPSSTNLTLPPYSLTAVQFSFVDPDVLYGWSLGTHPRLREADLKGHGQVRELADPTSCLAEPAGSYGLDLDLSADDRRFLGVLGPAQDREPFVYLYDRKLGCRWYNTETGEVGGDWGPKGMVSTPERFLVHNARFSRLGDYAAIMPAGGSYLVVWQVDTLKVTTCSKTAPGYCGGHFAIGYSHLIDQSGYHDPMDVLIRPLSELGAARHLVDLFPPKGGWPDRHWSWNNDNPEDTAPVCGSTYLSDNPATPGSPLHETRAWDNEIICVRTDGHSSTIWRFAHTFSSARNGFWSTPRGNVSRDGRFFLFTSDWMNTLGVEPDGKGHRTDVFLVELE
jgi:hypothetical protein